MKTIVKLSAAAAVCAGLSGPATASSLTDTYTSFWVLGDSLSDDGSNLFKFSDGDVWNEPILDDFGDAASGNYAYSSATAGLNLDGQPRDLGGVSTIDLTGQTDLLLSNELGNFGSDPLVAIWIGANDIGAYFDRTLTPEETVAGYAASISRLIAAGVSDFLVFEVPDLGNSLRYINDPGLSAAVNGAVEQLNATFSTVRSRFEDAADFTLIETYGQAFTAATTPEFFGGSSAGPCVRSIVAFAYETIADCEETTFWDGFHPTELVHDYVRDEVHGAFAAVPLPATGWLLFGAFGGLAAMRRRAA